MKNEIMEKKLTKTSSNENSQQTKAENLFN